MDDDPLGEPHQLKIYVSLDHPLAIRDINSIQAKVDQAFSRFAREEFGLRNRHLTVLRSGTDSWWAILQEVYATYEMAKDHPDVVGAFVPNLDATLKILTGSGPGDLKGYLADLLRDVAAIGQRTGAQAISFASKTKLRIDRLKFAQIIAGRRKVHPARKPATDGPPLISHDAIVEASTLASKQGLPGTVLRAEGNWYLRGVGLHGVLIPLYFSGSAPSLIEGQMYVIEGFLRRSAEGFPVGVEVRIAHGPYR